jgi:hypothetical protein
MGSSSEISYLWIMAAIVMFVGPAALLLVVTISLRGTKSTETGDPKGPRDPVTCRPAGKVRRSPR